MSRTLFAKRSITACALVLTTLAPAFASSHYETMYRDTIRPHGQPRSQKVYDAALDYCYGQTGLSRAAADTDAFKACMSGRGYQWKWTKDVPELAAHIAHRPAERRHLYQFRHRKRLPQLRYRRHLHAAERHGELHQRRRSQLHPHRAGVGVLEFLRRKIHLSPHAGRGRAKRG